MSTGLSKRQSQVRRESGRKGGLVKRQRAAELVSNGELSRKVKTRAGGKTAGPRCRWLLEKQPTAGALIITKALEHCRGMQGLDVDVFSETLGWLVLCDLRGKEWGDVDFKLDHVSMTRIQYIYELALTQLCDVVAEIWLKEHAQ